MKYIVSCVVTLFLITFFLSYVSAEEQTVFKEPMDSTAAMFSKEKEYNSKELIVKFRLSTSKEERRKLLQTKNIIEQRYLSSGNISLVSVPSGIDLLQLAEDLLKNRQVEHVEPNYQVKTTYTPSDSGFQKQWYLKKIGATKAWNLTKGSSRITVAVIDGGVQQNHPEFKDRIVHPYNMVTNSNTYLVDAHGTHVAGIIAAANDKKGTVGIAPNVNIMPINVFSGEEANVFTIIDAIDYAVKHEADIINMSLVSYAYSSFLEDAVNLAKSEGVVVIAASGNNDTYERTYPASFKSVIAVSSLGSNDIISDFSNFGSYIDFAAPGENIYSTAPNNKYKMMDGTSMASPVVSGVVALMLSKNPFISPTSVKDILKKSTVDLGRKGWDSLYGYGRIDAYRAVKNTTSAVTELKIGTTFTMDGKDKHSISFIPQKSTTMKVYIKNNNNETVRTIVPDSKSAGKKTSISWNGTLENKSFVSNGTYKLIIKLSNRKKTYYKTKEFKVVNKVKPELIVDGTSSQFSPIAQGKISIPIHLNETAKVTAKVYDENGSLINTLWNEKSLKGGEKYKLSWNGKTSADNLVADGNYKLRFTVIDSSGLKGKTKDYSINVDSTGPAGELTLSDEIYQIDGSTKNIGTLSLNERVTATAYITTSNGDPVKKLITNETIQPGLFEVSWNGKNDEEEWIAEDIYIIVIEIKDQLGNITNISKPITVESLLSQ